MDEGSQPSNCGRSSGFCAWRVVRTPALSSTARTFLPRSSGRSRFKQRQQRFDRLAAHVGVGRLGEPGQRLHHALATDRPSARTHSGTTRESRPIMRSSASTASFAPVLPSASTARSRTHQSSSSRASISTGTARASGTALRISIE
jgi:hypothetical protein